MSALNLTGNFELERNDYHLIFEYTPDYYVSGVRHMDYYGGGISFSEFDEVVAESKEYRKIMKYLKKYYGYPPFEYDVVAEKLKKYDHID